MTEGVLEGSPLGTAGTTDEVDMGVGLLSVKLPLRLDTLDLVKPRLH